MNDEFTCGSCGRTFKKQGYLDMHVRGKHPGEPTVWTMTDLTGNTTTTAGNVNITYSTDTAAQSRAAGTFVEPVAKPVEAKVEASPFRFESPQLGRLTPGGRFIKMVRPRCKECQRRPGVTRDWYKKCPHNPYVGLREVHDPVPIYSEPDEQGRRKVLEVEDRVYWASSPNLASVAVNIRVSSGEQVLRKRAQGWILPEELRTPEFPAGIAPICQWRECESQDIKFRTPYGDYCREMEAKLVVADYHGYVLEVGFDTKTLEKRRRQLADIRI